MKYGIWNVAESKQESVNNLVRAGYAPLVAMILAARGIPEGKDAQQYLDCDGAMPSPLLLRDMEKAAQRVKTALEQGERMAVFGDYDVDGITATCLLTDFLREQGGDVVPYIPGRLEEGYGLNPIAIRQLCSEGVRLIVTVDCGITAVEEAQLCKELGMELVITDHHECKETLPEAVAVVDPHRPDCTYPHKNLSGVGVAFKLAAAICGSQEQMLQAYGDMVCLGTVADVMLLQGENRRFVSQGLEMLKNTTRPGLVALMAESGCEKSTVSASSVGYILAPRINAAGRMGQIHLAIDLFLTKDPAQARKNAVALCELNRKRQAVEAEIYDQAMEMLPTGQVPQAIVLAEESWHQGVVGIVASRIAEECCCPTILICLDGEHGKASSRSYGGFNLFASLSSLSDLLESYGGHELAAGFTIRKENIPAFREALCRQAEAFSGCDDDTRAVLDTDCAIPPELFTLPNVDSLRQLEPCGNGCPKPVLVMENMVIERLSQVGSGRHMRLRLRNGGFAYNGIFFSATPESASVCQGETVDVAFVPQINEYRGERSVQMNILDLRPSCKASCQPDIQRYRALCSRALSATAAEQLLPDRQILGTVWRYLAARGSDPVAETPMCLCRKIVRWSGMPLSLERLLTCLDIFADVGLLEQSRIHKNVIIRMRPGSQKADLNQSATLQYILQAKES